MVPGDPPDRRPERRPPHRIREPRGRDRADRDLGVEDEGGEDGGEEAGLGGRGEAGVAEEAAGGEADESEAEQGAGEAGDDEQGHVDRGDGGALAVPPIGPVTSPITPENGQNQTGQSSWNQPANTSGTYIPPRRRARVFGPWITLMPGGPFRGRQSQSIAAAARHIGTLIA